MFDASFSAAIASSARMMKRKDFARAGAVGLWGRMRWAFRFRAKCFRLTAATLVASDVLAAGLEIVCFRGCFPAAAWSCRRWLRLLCSRGCSKKMQSVMIGRMFLSEAPKWKSHWQFCRELKMRVTFGRVGTSLLLERVLMGSGSRTSDAGEGVMVVLWCRPTNDA